MSHVMSSRLYRSHSDCSQQFLPCELFEQAGPGAASSRAGATGTVDAARAAAGPLGGVPGAGQSRLPWGAQLRARFSLETVMTFNSVTAHRL